MFTASMGAGLIAWVLAEPVFYIETPPFGIAPHSDPPTSSPMGSQATMGHRALGDSSPGDPTACMLFADIPGARDQHAVIMCCRRGKTTPLVIDIFVVLGIVGGVLAFSWLRCAIERLTRLPAIGADGTLRRCGDPDYDGCLHQLIGGPQKTRLLIRTLAHVLCDGVRCVAWAHDLYFQCR